MAEHVAEVTRFTVTPQRCAQPSEAVRLELISAGLFSTGLPGSRAFLLNKVMIFGGRREAKTGVILAEKRHRTAGFLHRAAIGLDAINKAAKRTNC